MENPMVNYKKIIADTNSKMFNVSDSYKDNTLEVNQALCKMDRLPFSVGMINVTGDLNVGMMIRSACLLGAENFYIFGRKKFDARSTVGAENYINIVQHVFDDPINSDGQILAELRELHRKHSVMLCEHGGYMLGTNDCKMVYEERPSPLFIFGSESHGIPKLITDQVATDGYPEWEFDRISIGQRSVLRSFNVSAAMAIVCWDYIREMKL